MNKQYTDIFKQISYSSKLSRLIAEENISVEFSDSAETASFSPERRVLTFPYNTMMMDLDIHDMFMMHEVSHALHLPRNSIDLVQQAKVDHSIFNIVVDIRDERLIKEKYPGSIKSFTRGYKKLVEREFFGDIDLITKKSFPDRLNVYAKCGPGIVPQIKFTEKELDFYNRCMKAETFDDVLELSKELMTFEHEEYSIDDIFYEMYGEEELSDEEKQEVLDKITEEMKKTTEDTTTSVFRESNIVNASFNSYVTDKSLNKHFVSAKRYLESVKKYIIGARDTDGDYITECTESVRETRRMISQSVDSMVRVFESRKSAERYKNAKISDTGLIDINKVFKYKIDDKIFRRATKMPQQKNHAYIIAVDFSGSMHKVFGDVIDQIIVITEFTRRIQVPYKVIAFGAQFDDMLPINDYDPKRKNPWINRTSDNFIEILNSDQSTVDHNTCLYGVLNQIKFSLCGTPTANLVSFVESISRDFFEGVKATSRKFIIITDGGQTDVYGGHKNFIVTDSVTQKAFPNVGTHGYSAIQAMTEILKARWNIDPMTISITSSVKAAHERSAFMTRHVTETENKDFRTKGYASILDNPNHPIFLVKPFTVEADISVDEELDMSTMSTTKIAKALTSRMKGVKKSRSFLNTLAENMS